MLPFGHIGAGYLIAYLLLSVTKPGFSSQEINQLLFAGALFGFIPDLDMFLAFIKLETFKIESHKTDHRQYLSHTPLLWLLAGLLVYFFSPSLFLKYFGALIFLGSWSHFVLDSLEHGIMWLWPFKTRLFSLSGKNIESFRSPKGFWGYWIGFVFNYAKKATLTFSLEVLLVVVSLIVFLFNK